jgi:hypothetical protein
MLLSRQQNAGQNNNIRLGDRSFENVAEFRYLGTTVTNQNLIQEEIKMKLNSGNACYHSVQNLLSSRLLSINAKIRIYKTIILPVVLYGCETWPTYSVRCVQTFDNFSSLCCVLLCYLMAHKTNNYRLCLCYISTFLLPVWLIRGTCFALSNVIIYGASCLQKYIYMLL